MIAVETKYYEIRKINYLNPTIKSHLYGEAWQSYICIYI